VAELRSLQGQGQAAQQELAELAQQAPGDTWLALVRAELAERLGAVDQAQRLYTQALGRQPDVYTRAAFADFWLSQGQPRKALALVGCDNCEADALVLRKALALQQLRDPQAASVAAGLQARFDAARALGSNLHLREEARLALEVWRQPERALSLAQSNWARQKEPADALLLARVAQALHRPELASGTYFAQAPVVDVRVAAVLRGERS
jgi:Tfp pilus assembly protein PilF